MQKYSINKQWLPFFLILRMASRKRFKNWRYGLFYFLATDEVGMAETSIIMEGYKSIEKGKYVKLLWPSDGVVYNARVFDLGGKFSEFDFSDP